MNDDPSGIASLLPLPVRGYPPLGVTLAQVPLIEQVRRCVSLQIRHSKRVTAKFVFLKGLLV